MELGGPETKGRNALKMMVALLLLNILKPTPLLAMRLEISGY